MKKPRTLNFIDLFCGAGGLSYGLEKAGLKCLAGIDFLDPAIETFKLNHPHAVGICGDLRELSPAPLKKKIKSVVGVDIKWHEPKLPNLVFEQKNNFKLKTMCNLINKKIKIRKLHNA